jgi:hypothetical protein
MMALMAERAVIACCVTFETKARVRAIAERKGITESTFVRQLLDAVLRTSTAVELPKPPKMMSRRSRLYLRLAAEDWLLLGERARARSMAPATYVTLLTRSHLRGAAPILKAEFLALREAVNEMTAMGRNLNQIARALNQGERTVLPGRAAVDAMIQVAGGLRDHFRALLRANELSWGSRYGISD